MTYKLLLADDSVTIQRVIELTFAEEDIHVVAVGDGQAAIDRLEADPPDIVLADVDMPKRDGYQVAAYVRSRPKLAHIPVVLLTGAFEPIDQARASAAGSSDVLAKPFEPQMVINRVKQLLARKREAEPSRPLAAARPGQPELRPPSVNRPPAPLAQTQAAGDAAQPSVSLDDYFDQLDAAFSNLQQPTGSAAAAAEAEEMWLGADPPSSSHPATQTMTAPADVAVKSSTSAEELFDELAAVPPAPAAASAAGMPTLAAPPQAAAKRAPVVTVPTFPRAAEAPPRAVAAVPTHLSGVVQVENAPNEQPVDLFAEIPPAPAEPVPPPAAPSITEDVIEAVVARVLERLSDRVVRETVSEIVSSTAERLVQEEISRIKSEGQ